jgi:hypothetical protein
LGTLQLYVLLRIRVVPVSGAAGAFLGAGTAAAVAAAAADHRRLHVDEGLVDEGLLQLQQYYPPQRHYDLL